MSIYKSIMDVNEFQMDIIESKYLIFNYTFMISSF